MTSANWSNMSDQDCFGILDSEFDHYLVDMKPYVLKLIDKTDRQRCALWIKKLCDPETCGSGLTGRKNRNMYARLLLHMLRKGVLEGPFTHKPEAGGLKTLPTYMSIYFDEPLLAKSQEQGSAVLPDWVSGELGQTAGSWSTSPLSNTHRKRNLFSNKSPTRPLSSSPIKRDIKDDVKMAEAHRRPPVSSDDSDFEARFNSWNLGIENPRYLRENPVPLSPIYNKSSLGKNSTLYDEATPVKADKEIEVRTKVLEAKHQEESLRMQQKHDAEIQKILDRKNGEIDELKSMYRGKQKEGEETIRRLEKRVQSLLRESQVIRQTKEKQISELKKMSDQSAESLKNEWEKKLHAAVAEMEQEKFDMQKKHTDNIQELLEDTNQRLAKMEAEYSSQMQATEQMLHELETRVKQLSVEVENGNLLRQKVTQEKAELEIHIASISAELQEANHRSISLQREMEQMREQHEDALQKLQTRHNADMSHFQQEHALSAAKASEVIEDLEQTVIHLKLQIQEAENRKQKQLRDQENKMQQEITDLQNITDKKLQTLQAELEKERANSKRKMNKMENSLRDKEEQLVRLRDSQRLQAQQAESALENFKKQVELSSEKTYADMKQQMEKVEADLIRSKSLREKQSKEFSYQLEELQRRYEQQIVELKLQHEQERTHLLQTHNAEKDSLVQDHQREIDSLDKHARAAMVQQQTQTQEWRKRDAQTISDLEVQVHSLRKELLAAHSQRKQQLTELGVLREEERQRAARDQQAALDRLRAEMDQVRQDLERTHKAERELAQEKTNSRLKHLEKEYNQKLAKSAQVIAELQTSLSSIKEDGRQTQESLERQLQEAQGRWDEERRQINRDADQTNKVLQERVEALQRQLHAVEKKLMGRELEYQEQITHVRQECESKIKGLIPAELQQELEDTITSLKSQVSFLQKRASVLQEQLDASHIRR
ncbi:centrosomal protein of 112 kDa-like isoform X1 [Cyprinus carpio]|uniref:Centrosomal protein of 112 kDa-like isoform X1 n=1 Tax=Cyprinus carpio TaxID=7962 RepID=A0A9Q9W4V9_CYPCA|nr:centrosomal protein of 112 kDa-like isoform X1 [Cyprinus carpio]XP_042576874.1 centrosomal protein of 112 kDa-like isoform X1 [Cyprinus carpio]